MRCGGVAGDYAGEIEARDLLVDQIPGEAGSAVVFWQGGGTRCGDILGDYLGKLIRLRWHVFVDTRLVSVVVGNRLEIEIDPESHSIIEVLGVADNVAHITSTNLLAPKPGGNRIRFSWTHDGQGAPARFFIYWDSGAGETPATLYATAPFEIGRTDYEYLTAPLEDGNYNFGITVGDTAGNETALLQSSVSIIGIPDPPDNLDYAYEAADRSLTLTWN